MRSHTESYWPCVWDTQDTHFRLPQLEKGPKRKQDQREAFGGSECTQEEKAENGKDWSLRGSSGENREKR